MQFFSDHSIKDWTSVSDSSKPTFASIGKLTVISYYAKNGVLFNYQNMYN